MAFWRRRVKIYHLNEDQFWDQLCKGLVSSVYDGQHHSFSVQVRSEYNGSLLFQSRMSQHIIFHRQEDNLIVWAEDESPGLALSFQHSATCQMIWEDICRIQGIDPSVDITQDLPCDSEGHYLGIPDTSTLVDLPSCEISKLERIANLVNSVHVSPVRKERVALALEGENYIQKLLKLLNTCELLGDMNALHHLYEIVKGILFLNKTYLLEVMFSDECIMDVVGCLEYDPALAQPRRHRAYLNENAHFNEVVPITDSELKKKIHQTYKIEYIYDILVPVPPLLEENTLSSLNTYIEFNKIEIITLLQENETLLFNLIADLRDKTTAINKKLQLLCFLKELCDFCQILDFQSKDSFFQTLTHLGLLSALKITVSMGDAQLRATAIDIFVIFVAGIPSVVRRFLIDEIQYSEIDRLFINVLIEQIISDSDPELGTARQLIEVVCYLLDPDNMYCSPDENEYLNFFYDHCMHALLEPLLVISSGEQYERDSMVQLNPNNYHTAQLLSVILDLLIFCVRHHSYHIQNVVLSRDLLRRVLTLTTSKHTFLVLSALRFMRAMIGRNNEHFNCYIIEGNLFEPVITALLNNGTRYNMLNSAIVDMFEYIRVEDIKPLVAHIIENFHGVLEPINYVQTFKGLKINYDEEKCRQSKIQDNTDSLVCDETLCINGNIFKEKQQEFFPETVEDDNESMPPLETFESEDPFLPPWDSTTDIQMKVKDDLLEGTSGRFTLTSSPSDSADVVDLAEYEKEDKEAEDKEEEDKEEEDKEAEDKEAEDKEAEDDSKAED